MISLAGIPRATLEDVGLAGHTLLMPMHYYRMQGCLTAWAALLVGIGRDDRVVHLALS
jgi:hypothetical protein